MTSDIITILFSASVSAILTSYGTFKVTMKKEERKTEKRKRKLRKAFKEEMRFELDPKTETTIGTVKLSEVSKSEVSDYDFGVPLNNPFDRTIYENNSSELGLLKDKEIELIVKYYIGVNILNELFESIKDQYRKNQEVREDTENKFTKNLKTTMEIREKALNKIEENLKNNY